MTSRNFEVAMKKGAIGEGVCRRYLECKGWIVYQPITDGAHAFDMLAIKDKKRAVAIDIKAKARLNCWRATGINQRHFEEYVGFSQKHLMPFWLFFVDEGERQIYGNNIERLEMPVQICGVSYPRVMSWNPPTRVWHLDQMLVIANLGETEAGQLAELNQRSYKYAPRG